MLGSTSAGSTGGSSIGSAGVAAGGKRDRLDRLQRPPCARADACLASIRFKALSIRLMAMFLLSTAPAATWQTTVQTPAAAAARPSAWAEATAPRRRPRPWRRPLPIPARLSRRPRGHAAWRIVSDCGSSRLSLACDTARPRSAVAAIAAAAAHCRGRLRRRARHGRRDRRGIAIGNHFFFLERSPQTDAAFRTPTRPPVRSSPPAGIRPARRPATSGCGEAVRTSPGLPSSRRPAWAA